MKLITPLQASLRASFGASFRAYMRAERIARFGRHSLLALGCALVLSLFGSSFWQAGTSLRALGNLQLHAERTGRVDSLMIQLVEAENGVRGYLLTRNRAYLEPYLNSLATVSYTLDDIHLDLGKGPENKQILAQLTGLITLRMRILSDEVERGQLIDRSASADGRRYMDEIRKTLGEIKRRTRAQGQQSFDESIAHVDRTRWVVATLSGAALALLLILFLVLRAQVRLREQIARLLAQENVRLERQVRARTAELSDLASYLTNTREAEKARLARELHDELGALLTAVRMDVAWIARKLDPAALAPHRERFDRLLRTLDSGITLKRRIIDDLRPPLLQELGLVAALRTLGEEFAKNAGVEVALDLPDGDVPLPSEVSLALFRIAQEALTNVRRHAHARRVELSLQITPERTELAVADDGAGFDAAAARGRHGLAGIRHRVQMFAGELAIDSRPGQGTRIRASLPYERAVQGEAAANAAQ
ncbi:CHASE3 domain-containing protein [Aromatoleum toluclasticum]|uniref:CHASE3 domain-containing protein n=1 Tax=Aromatoleum toluclasticum TaxID=92003 RepID=UPI001D17FDF4|nr:CHASE3 domain-containing protein [Aromatoleum toluclasticum]MCC4118375.1 CHASE3 domain-containing protein [Aromatoleum toluclasticum]